MTDVEILRLSAFAAEPDGGNPAGVVLNATTLTEAAMQRIAAEVGYAETAFLTSLPADSTSDGTREVTIRYYSPIAEVPFCGHATIATAVALAERVGTGRFHFHFHTASGMVAIDTSTDANGNITAAFTSIEPHVRDLPAADLDALLTLLRLQPTDLHSDYPPRIANAGNDHPLLVLADAATFDTFTFDPAAARVLMDDRNWQATITILRAITRTEFEARNIFPVGTLSEDPATGSAAASTGAYLRALGRITPPTDLTIWQGRHIGRPSRLHVQVPTTGGITVSGGATPIPGSA